MEERRRGRVDGSCEEHESIGKNVGCEPQDGVSIDACMLEIDTRRSVCADDDLKLECS